MRAQADSMQSSGMNMSTEGPEAKVNPLFQGVQHLISLVWLEDICMYIDVT